MGLDWQFLRRTIAKGFRQPMKPVDNFRLLTKLRLALGGTLHMPRRYVKLSD